MDRPAKRQKLSNDIIAGEALQNRETRPHRRRVVLSRRPAQVLTLSRTADLDRALRPALAGDGPSELRRRSAGYVVLPRRPDVTVTAAAVEVIVNNGQLTSLVPAPTSDTPVALGTLGTLTVSAISTTSTTVSTSVRVSGLPSDASSRSNEAVVSSTAAAVIFSPSSSSNGTITASPASSAQKTATVTATSTLHVSYNGTFIIPTTQSASTSSRLVKTITSQGSVFVTTDSSDSATPTYTFGEDISSTESPEIATSISSSSGTLAASTGIRTGAGVGAGSTSGSTGGPAATSSPSPTPNTTSGLAPLTPQQSQMVGGIVGGFAGIALVLVLILFFLRWYRARLRMKGRLPNQLGTSHNLSSFGGDTSLLRSSGSIAQTSKSSFVPASWVTKWRPSPNTSNSNLTTNEKGFQRLSGRKIPSVFTHGGDGYGGIAINPRSDPYTRPSYSSQSPAHSHVYNASASTFYRDSDSTLNYHHHQPPSRPELTAPYPSSLLDPTTTQTRRPSLSALAADHSKTSTHDFATSRDLLVTSPRPFSPQVARHIEGYAMIRDSPARTPVTLSPNASSVRLPVRAPLSMDADVPSLPVSPVGLGLGHDLRTDRALSGVSSRSGVSTVGRFREEI